MRIRIAGFNHPKSDKSLVYREVVKLETLFKLIEKAVGEGANLFSIRILGEPDKKLGDFEENEKDKI